MEDRAACFTGYPISPTPYRYLNSGTWIGRADISSQLLHYIKISAGNNFKNANDQKLVADIFINKSASTFNIKLDYYATLFQSMHMTLDPPLPRCNPYEDMIVIENGIWHNKRTKSKPAVFHFNGGGKTHHLNMESKMWYKQSKYNTIDQINKLGDTLLNVPSKENGYLKFKDLCTEYIRNKKIAAVHK